MPPTSQELSLLINPLVPESVTHNNRVATSIHLPPIHHIPQQEQRVLTADLDTRKPTFPHSLPTRHRRRHSRPPVRLRLHILPARHHICFLPCQRPSSERQHTQNSREKYEQRHFRRRCLLSGRWGTGPRKWWWLCEEGSLEGSLVQRTCCYGGY